mgnify:CR=1 FL=1
MASIREKIYLRIRELGIKQNDLCAKMGSLKVQNLSAYLRGKRTIPYDDLEKLCMILGLTLGDVNKVYNSNREEVCLENE